MILGDRFQVAECDDLEILKQALAEWTEFAKGPVVGGGAEADLEQRVHMVILIDERIWAVREERSRRALQPGDQVILWSCAGGYEDRRVATVVEVRRGRIYTDTDAMFGGGHAGNSWYAKSGKNCDAPTGQSKLLIPELEAEK